MDNTPLRVTQTHSSEETEGGLLGVPFRFLVWVVPMVLVAAALFLHLAAQIGTLQAAVRTLLPVALLILVIRLIHRAGPLGFLLDGIRQLILGGNASPLPSSGHPGSTLFSPLPDGFISDGLVLFGGLQGHAAMGFWIEFPDLRNSSFAERNRAQEVWSAVLRLIPEGWSIQITAMEDTRSLSPELLAYGEHTQTVLNATSRALRNANFLHLWRMLESGHLRRRRLALLVGFRLPSAAPTDTSLASAQATLSSWGQTVRQTLARMNARTTPMSDVDLIRCWADSLAPSTRRQRNHDASQGFDPTRSILDNLWNSEIQGGRSPGFVLDGVHHLCLCLKRLPSETYLGIAQALTQLPFAGITVTLQIARVPKEPLLQRAQGKLERIHRQQLSKPNPRLAVTHAQLEAKIQRLTALGVAPLEMELIVVVRADSSAELLDRAAAVKAAIHRMNGAQAFEATLPVSTRSLFAKALPGWISSHHQGFRHYIEDPNATDLLPLVSSFTGHPARTECLFPGADGGLVNVVTQLGEGSGATPQNQVVVGLAGSGKSSVVTKILFETCDEIAFTALVESGLSQAPFSRALGAEPVLFKADGPQTINFASTHGQPRSPFLLATTSAVVARMVGLPKDDDRARTQLALIARGISRVMGEHAEECLRSWPLPRRDAVVRHSVVLQKRRDQSPMPLTEAFLQFEELRRVSSDQADAELAAVTESEMRAHECDRMDAVLDLLFAGLAPEEHLTLSALKEAFELSDDEDSRRLAVLLEPYCRSGLYGALFDGPTNVAQHPAVQHFELGQIPEAARDLEAIVGFIAINFIRDRCLSLPRSLRKRVVIDEVSRFLSVPGGESILRELFEGFRKHNTQAIIIGQQYSRIADSPIRAAIVGNTRSWIIFNTGDPKDIARLGEDIGLSNVAQEAIGRFARPDQMSGQKYSEFLYFHTSDPQPICGVARYYLLPTETPEKAS
jgi:type IV secretion system protein TrbE